MATEAAFFQALEESPADDSNALIYADWLAEQGEDDRAAFVRVQCVLAKRDEAWDIDYPLLKARQDRLYNLHIDEWMEQHRKKYGKDVIRRFSSGVPCLVDVQRPDALMRKASVALAPPLVALNVTLGESRGGFLELPELSRVNELILHHLAAGPLDALTRSTHLGRLRKLTLGGPHLTADQLETLFRLPIIDQLTDLSVRDYYDEGWVLFRRPRPANLRRLHLMNISLTEEALRSLGSADWAGLQELHLEDVTHPGGVATAEAFASEHLASLEVLAVKGNPGFGTAEAAAVFRNKALAKLRKLHLTEFERGHGRRSDGLSESLSRLDLPALQYLDLGDNRFKPAAAEALARSPVAPRLVGMKWRGCETLKKAGAAALAKGDFRSLRSLDLGSIGMGNEGLKALLAAPWMAGLVSLDLNNNQLKAPAGTLLAESANVASLRVLNLTNNALGDRGVVPVVGSPHLARLQALYLTGTDPGARAMEALAAAPMLENLVVLMLALNEGTLGEEDPLVLGESGRCKNLQSIWWDWDNIDDEPDAQERVTEAFGPGIYDFNRHFED